MNRPQYTYARRMRSEPTASENLLWQSLRRNQLDGLVFRRQHVIPASRFTADFCCVALRLIVEIDGGYHSEQDQVEKDQEREMLIRDLGYTFIRLTDEQVMHDLRGVLRVIRQTVHTIASSPNETGIPLYTARGEGLGEG